MWLITLLILRNIFCRYFFYLLSALGSIACFSLYMSIALQVLNGFLIHTPVYTDGSCNKDKRHKRCFKACFAMHCKH